MPEIHDIAPSIVRRRILVTGIVQGVGFRPTVYRIATALGLAGWVRNAGSGVTIEIQGDERSVEAFPGRLRAEAPSPSSIHDIDVIEIDVIEIDVMDAESLPGDVAGASFVIDVSEGSAPADTMIAPDIATCPDCLRELQDSGDRRYGYAFLNCTNCGPRYTIVRRIPYDRPLTSMAAFEQCPDCQREYDDPADRRFHAQPNACPTCGPRLSVIEGESVKKVEDPVAHVRSALAAGRIVAVRGIGGFHLAVDTRNAGAVKELRRRKQRTDKPFAIMARDVEIARRFVHVSEAEERLLHDPARPIVLLDKRTDSAELCDQIAPGQSTLGVMLPYAPLHHLLLAGLLDILVMTSANVAEEPIITGVSSDGTSQPSSKLVELSDLILTHDREILQRCDDSVVRMGPTGPFPIRRSRGYVPRPVRLDRAVPVPMLAVGGHLKSTIALARGRDVVMSQHIGDLDNPAALGFFEEIVQHLSDILQIEPEMVVCDRHPEYLSTKWARHWAKERDLPIEPVQHHHAHFAGVLAEHGHNDRAIGLILDGTGFGPDGTIWGGEILVGTAASSERCAHLEQMLIPGGDVAIRNPWRLGAALLRRHLGPNWHKTPMPGMPGSRTASELALIDRMMDRGLNAPITSSAGRLFDGVASLLGIGETVTYEAQAAIELETLARSGAPVVWPTLDTSAVDPTGVIPTDDLIAALLCDLQAGISKADIAARFHASFAHKLSTAVLEVADTQGLSTCALSGGVFQNSILLNSVVRNLEVAGLRVLLPSLAPANDGGLSFGQVAAVAARYRPPLAHFHSSQTV